MSETIIRLVPLREMPEELRLVVRCAADTTPRILIGSEGAIASW